MTSCDPKALLVSLRDPNDAMAHHERMCFAESAKIPEDHITVHAMVDGPLPTARLHHYDAVFFGGSGAYSVLDDITWIQQGMVALQRVVEARVPAWASCFGFQGLAVALGGKVIRDDDRTEMGSTLLHLTKQGRDDPLLSRLPDPFWAQEGHHDRVSEIPEGVVLLATGDVCPAQAFRVEGAPFWASQFHPELSLQRTIDRFEYYRTHYFEGSEEEADKLVATLRQGSETTEMSSLLARLIRGDFAAV
jgi:GMP synthase (glutamine-hydrolysing)